MIPIISSPQPHQDPAETGRNTSVHTNSIFTCRLGNVVARLFFLQPGPLMVPTAAIFRFPAIAPIPRLTSKDAGCQTIVIFFFPLMISPPPSLVSAAPLPSTPAHEGKEAACGCTRVLKVRLGVIFHKSSHKQVCCGCCCNSLSGSGFRLF